MNKRPLYISLVVYLIVGGIIGGIILGKAIEEPKVITEQLIIETATILYEKSPPEIVYRYFNVPVKVEVEVQQELKLFENIDELEQFLDGYIGHSQLKWKFFFEGEDIDCDDFAQTLTEYAREYGYDIVWETRSKGTRWNGERLDKSHMFNAVIIGNEVYFIDPVTLEYWKAYQID